MSKKSSQLFRVIEDRDVKELIQIRTMAKENVLTMEDLIRYGITEETVTKKLHETFKGWLCECDGRIVGFTIGNSEDGEMWVITVLPEFERKGIGKKLLSLVTDWLFKFQKELWLTTEDNPKNRAYHLYTKAGWKKVSAEDGHCKMILNK